MKPQVGTYPLTLSYTPKKRVTIKWERPWQTSPKLVPFPNTGGFLHGKVNFDLFKNRVRFQYTVKLFTLEGHF